MSTPHAHDPFRTYSAARPATKLEWDIRDEHPPTIGFNTPKAGPAIRLQWDEDGQSLSTGLVLVVRAKPDVSAVDLAFGIIDCVAAVNALDRWLGGSGFTRSTISQSNGDASITLVPIDPNGAIDRIQQICEECNRSGNQDARIPMPASIAGVEARVR